MVGLQPASKAAIVDAQLQESKVAKADEPRTVQIYDPVSAEAVVSEYE